MEKVGFASEVVAELARARTMYPKVASLHEGWAIIHEESCELWDLVRSGAGASGEEERKELVQIAAMCQRVAEDLDL
jgi:hypothetical protein